MLASLVLTSTDKREEEQTVSNEQTNVLFLEVVLVCHSAFVCAV